MQMREPVTRKEIIGLDPISIGSDRGGLILYLLGDIVGSLDANHREPQQAKNSTSPSLMFQTSSYL